MDKLLLKCNDNLTSLPCCHSDNRKCDCYACLRDGFYEMPDTYDCEKKMNYYVLNYGPSWASEIYHYLSNSQILEGFCCLLSNIKIISLGCGFAPDLMAISKYIYDKHLPLQFEYLGIDKSNCWNSTRYNSANAKFIENDVISVLPSINFNDYDLVILTKLFSTLYKHDSHKDFLATFSSAVQTQLRNDSVVLFNDINNVQMGRDVFHGAVLGLFRNCRQFYCANPYYKSNWIRIPENNIVFSVPRGLCVTPMMEIRQNIFFEYRK